MIHECPDIITLTIDDKHTLSLRVNWWGLHESVNGGEWEEIGGDLSDHGRGKSFQADGWLEFRAKTIFTDIAPDVIDEAMRIRNETDV